MRFGEQLGISSCSSGSSSGDGGGGGWDRLRELLGDGAGISGFVQGPGVGLLRVAVAVFMVLECGSKVLGLAPADGCDGFDWRLASRFSGFFQDRLGKL